ncbi:MAG: hypothetical protein NVS1B4_06940 [Gemmatimonadaceae bacterium]
MTRKSSQIQLTLVASLAALAAGCGSSSTKCVDASDRVVPDSLCATVATADSAHGGRGTGSAVSSPYHHYLGGWWIWGLWGLGRGRVFGGSPAPAGGVPAAGVQGGAARGGFGATGAAHGAGGGASGSAGS